MSPRMPPGTIAVMSDRANRLRFVTVSLRENVSVSYMSTIIKRSMKSFGVSDPFLVRVTPLYWTIVDNEKNLKHDITP